METEIKEKRKYKKKEKVNDVFIVNYPSKISFECSNIENDNIEDFESDIDAMSFRNFIILYYPNFKYLFKFNRFSHLFK